MLRSYTTARASSIGPADNRQDVTEVVELHDGVRQHVRDRGTAGRASRRPQLAAEGELRALCRAVVGLAVHRAAGLEPALVALSHPSDRAPRRPVRARRWLADPHRAAARGRTADRAVALGSDADPGREAHP